MSAPLIELRGVQFAYVARRPVLADLNFTINAGDRIGITGANGGGKSTLLQLIVGLLKPTGGDVICFGQPRTSESDFIDVRRRVGLLFQDSNDQLFCPTVAEDIAFGPLNLGKSRDEAALIVQSTLDAVGLPGYEERITYKLSGGEKRLVALATVLAMEPELLLLDEPLTGLDEDHLEKIQGVLATLEQAMLIVAHDHAFLKKIARNTVVLRAGKIELMEGD
ncbi:MAG: energy-coupling factor ABC transporter ATP-binding protein [Candidatus Hydrogenedentes bacterium]|nr:energy-coupling factor ABC transporter ATP-binding protein [Candidatus Hydrogenedentota bacterium]